MDGREIKLVGRVKADVITLFTISQNLKSVDPLPSNSILIKIYNQNGYVKQSTHKNLALAFFFLNEEKLETISNDRGFIK